MRSALQFLGLVGILALGISPPLRADHETTAQDIIRMRKGGLRDGTILEFLRTYRARVLLNGRGAAELVEAGFREEFIQALLDYAKSQPPEGGSHARNQGDPPPAAPRYRGTFYVGYACNRWAFPPWYYWDHHVHLGAGWGHYGWGHWGGHRTVGHRGGFGHHGGSHGRH